MCGLYRPLGSGPAGPDDSPDHDQGRRRLTGPRVNQSMTVRRNQTVRRTSQYTIASGQARISNRIVIRQPWSSCRWTTMIFGRSSAMAARGEDLKIRPTGPVVQLS